VERTCSRTSKDDKLGLSHGYGWRDDGSFRFLPERRNVEERSGKRLRYPARQRALSFIGSFTGSVACIGVRCLYYLPGSLEILFYSVVMP
jgi:hypothetical protein